MDLGGWLRSLDLQQYETAFRENAIDETVLPDLTDQDLEKLGVLLGHRRKLLRAIASFKNADNAPPAIPTSAGPPATPIYQDTAERRQVTVMFSDLVGSTALSARMDPEDLREVIAAYQKCVAETVGRSGGFVAKYMGDGVLVYFGYPQAHEDDAERAVRAGLELVAAVGSLRTSVTLRTRVGIATGLAVVGDLIGSGGSQEQAIVGETPNLAARLQGIAQPNGVVIAESTRKLVGNLFELDDLGAQDLKGLEGSVRAWATLRPAFLESRFEALHASGLTALVGREEETELLLRRWSRAKSGEGQVVLLSGEAGIGKSRLTASLLESLATEPHTRLRYFCSPQHTDSALYPIIGQMERAAGLAHEDTAKARLDKLDALLAQTSTSVEDTVLLAEMLSLSNDGRYPPLDKLTSEQRRQRTLQALVSQMETLARQNPVLMIFEDAHWTDPTSLEAFNRVVERVATLRVLLIVTFRPEFEPPWIGRPYVTALTLNRLTQREVGVLIDRVVGNKPLPTGVRNDIIDRSDGIPLFIEEMTKATLEAESQEAAEQTIAAIPSSARAVPASLHASLMARLDRLGAAKEVAQIGAAIGREFSHALLTAVVCKPDAELRSALDRLIASGLLFRQGVPPHATYLFKHALVQDAAYGTLLRGPRQALHARIAAVMQERFSEIVERAPEILAHDLTEAGELDAAAKYWLEAGRRAAGRSANIEAVAHLTRGIAVLKNLPETSDRAELELALHLALGPALMATKGMGAQEAQSTYRRAGYLAEHLGDDLTRFKALWGLWLSVAATSGKESEALSDELCQLAERLGDSGFRLQAHHSAWTTLLWSGRLLESREHVRQGLSLYDRHEHRGHALTYGGHDPGVCALGIDALLSWLLGYPDQAVQSARNGIDLAATLSHFPSVGHSLLFAALIHYLRRDVPMLLECSERLIALGREYGLAQYKATGDMAHGWALAQLGRVDLGLSELRRAFSLYGAIAKFYSALFSTMLAEAELRGGSVAEAITVVEAGDRESIDLFWRAGILNVKGYALAAQHNREAEACFRASLDIAREQQAKSLELRAATGLARLYQHQGRRPEARDLLAPVYGWFTEGFDTRDLKEAKALLNKLSE